MRDDDIDTIGDALTAASTNLDTYEVHSGEVCDVIVALREGVLDDEPDETVVAKLWDTEDGDTAVFVADPLLHVDLWIALGKAGLHRDAEFERDYEGDVGLDRAIALLEDLPGSGDPRTGIYSAKKAATRVRDLLANLLEEDDLDKVREGLRSALGEES